MSGSSEVDAKFLAESSADPVQEEDPAVVHRLPVEILRAIFALAQGRITIADELFFESTVNIPPNYFPFLATSRVCHKWHQIITGTPEFWSTICIPRIRSHFTLNLALKYSGGAPLRVMYDQTKVWNASKASVEETTDVRNIFGAVLAESSRIQELYVTIPVGGITAATYQLRTTTTGLLCRPFPSLQVYHVFFDMPPIYMDFDQPAHDVDFTLGSNILPALEELRIRNSSSVQWEGLRTVSTLKVLDVVGGGPTLITDPSILLRVLSDLPVLEVLRVDLTRLGEEPSQQANPIQLDKLRSLRIYGTSSMCTQLIRCLRVPRSMFLEVCYPSDEDAAVVTDPLLSILPQRTDPAQLSTLALSIASGHDGLRGWQVIIPENCDTLPNCHDGAVFHIDVGLSWDGCLVESAQTLPISDVREVIVRPGTYTSSNDLAAEVALGTVSMPQVESLWFYPARIAAVDQWMSPLSTPTETAGGCPWPALKTLVFRNTRYDDEQLVIKIRDVLMKREAHGCTRLERLVISRSVITEASIDLLRPHAEQLVAYGNRAELPEAKANRWSDEFEPLL